jgi:anti-anti-sigma factor
LAAIFVLRVRAAIEYNGSGREVNEMKLTKRYVRDVVDIAVVEIHGKLLGAPEDSDLFHGCIRSLIEDGYNKIIISLRYTPLADSLGIGMLIGGLASSRNAGGELVLSHVGTRIMKILKVTKLLLIFKTYETVAEAVDYLSATVPDGAAPVPGVGTSPDSTRQWLV